MGDKHAVYVDVLRGYADKLKDDLRTAGEIEGLVGQSDVGDRSWGIVGIFVKQTYTDLLADLRDLLVEMGSGLNSASLKISGCADIYETTDEAARATFEKILKELGSKSVPSATIGPR